MTQEVDDFLAHFGVKGMHWGVRKEDSSSGSGKSTALNQNKEPQLMLTKKFSSGDSVSIYKDPDSSLVRLLSRHFPNYAEDASKLANFTFRDKDGTKVGDATFARESPDSLYLIWVGIKRNHRGKGYASAGLKGVIEYAKKENIKTLRLEVPGNAPDAQHIYTKMGFKQDGATSGNKKDVWGGLSDMKLHLDGLQHAETELDNEAWENQFAKEFAQFLSENVHLDPINISHRNVTEEFLAHFGVKGLLAENDARIIVKRAFPKADIKPPISYRGLYLFQVFTDDPEEGEFDPFFSVNQQTGELRDFSVITDGDINEITDLFLKKQGKK